MKKRTRQEWFSLPFDTKGSRGALRRSALAEPHSNAHKQQIKDRMANKKTKPKRGMGVKLRKSGLVNLSKFIPMNKLCRKSRFCFFCANSKQNAAEFVHRYWSAMIYKLAFTGLRPHSPFRFCFLFAFLFLLVLRTRCCGAEPHAPMGLCPIPRFLLCQKEAKTIPHFVRKHFTTPIISKLLRTIAFLFVLWCIKNQ